MATLTGSDLAWIVGWLRRSQYQVTLKGSGLSRPQISAALQAIEDYSVGSYNSRPAGSLKAAIEAATGATPTLAQNQAMWFAWAAWKSHSNQAGG